MTKQPQDIGDGSGGCGGDTSLGDGWIVARVIDGDSLTANDPIARLRDRIVWLRVGGHRINETEAVAITIIAWNASRAGGTRAKFQLPKDALTTKNFPEPT